MKDFMKKGQYIKEKLIIALALSVFVAIILNKFMVNRAWDNIIIFTAITMFTLLHAILPLKKMYDFIYNKRYIIALSLFAYIVVMGYSGSSIGCYSNCIQPKDMKASYLPILGTARSIRSDEWYVNTPISVSQTIDEDSKFSYYNDNARGTTTEMFSIAASPVTDVLILAKPFFIGFILFGAERGLSVLWFGKMIALFMVSFELAMLLTNKKKLVSLFSAILVLFSAATQWWNLTEFIIWGGLALVLFDKFMLTDKYKTKILCGIGIFISAIAYVFIMYPAWQLSYGYVYIPIFVWIIWKNRKLYKINWKDILIVLVILLAIISIGVRYIMLSGDVVKTISSTDYPGERFEIGGGGIASLFSYVYSILFPYKKTIVNPCELSGMISIYPIPMIIAVIFLIKNKDRKKHFSFLIPALIIGLMLSVWTIMPTNKIFAKLTFLYMVPGNRASVPLGYLQILLMTYIMGNIKKEDKLIKSKIIAVIVSSLASVGIMYMAINNDLEHVLGNLTSYVCGILLFTEVYLLFTIDKEESKKWLMVILIPVAILTGATVNPIQKGIDVLRDKPIAKKVQEIVKEDPENNMWIAETFPNYFLASGARMINSVNTYPNFELFKTIFGEENYLNDEYKKIYNRYAHMDMLLTHGENEIKLIQADSIRIRINPETVKELGIKYIISVRELEEFSNENIEFEKIYDELGMFIYKVNS